MARYTDSVCRLCRREGTKLFLKGDRCYSPKCSVVKRPTPPGRDRHRTGVQDRQNTIVKREKQKVATA